MYLKLNNETYEYAIRSFNYTHISDGKMENEINIYLDPTSPTILAANIDELIKYLHTDITSIVVEEDDGTIIYDIHKTYVLDYLNDSFDINDAIRNVWMRLRLKA